MSNDNEGNNEVICGYCETTVNEDDDFCPECGTLFTEDANCMNHPEIPAEGVCIICGSPYCKECGYRINKLFLCALHSDYEIYEGMAKVFGTPEESTAEFIRFILIQGGFHPILFSREGPYGGLKHMFSFSKTNESTARNLITEVKVLVPCAEVTDAEELLRDQRGGG